MENINEVILAVISSLLPGLGGLFIFFFKRLYKKNDEIFTKIDNVENCVLNLKKDFNNNIRQTESRILEKISALENENNKIRQDMNKLHLHVGELKGFVTATHPENAPHFQ